ncbi:MAG: hypothetical protein COB89_06650, partial [Piscirickettsiaceae bacterium]
NQYRQATSTNPWQRNGLFNYWTLSSPNDTPVYSLDLQQNDEHWHIAFITADEQNRVTLMVNETRMSLRLSKTSNHAYLAEFDDERLPLTGIVNSTHVDIHALSQQNHYQVVPVIRDKHGEIEGENSVNAPMMGEIINVVVKEGDQVEEGDLLIVMESMKMQLQIEAVSSGVVSKIHCQVGDNVARGAVVVDVNSVKDE